MRLNYKGKHLFVFSDTHGMHRKLSIPKGTDILICVGDVVSDFQKDGLSDFLDWFSSCPAQLRLFVPGNHEIIFDLCPEEARRLIPANVTLLEDYGIEYDDITFYAISSRMIQQMQWLGGGCGLPYKTDFLITHIPSKGILDEDMGSEVLKQIIRNIIFSVMYILKEEYARKSGAQSLAMSPPFRYFAKQMINPSYSVSRFGL